LEYVGLCDTFICVIAQPDISLPRYFDMKSFLVMAVLLIGSEASACDLSLVAPRHSDLKDPVRANVSLADGMLTARFSVSAPPLNAKKNLGPNEYPYEFDVVELFMTFSDTGFPYYEFEVSPYNQTFQVRIVGAKQHHEGVDLGLMSAATISPGGWTAELKIPLRPLGWDDKPENIRGNLYSVLGQPHTRSFWSAFLPQAAKANFHQPKYFQSLLSGCGKDAG
jgi:hypothetical protein